MENGRNAVCGYIVVAAASHEAAAKLIEGHPRFALLPGDAVEVMPCDLVLVRGHPGMPGADATPVPQL